MAKKYDPLSEYLKVQKLHEFELNFEKVEQILGQKLPESRVRAQFWANIKKAKSHPQAKAIRDSGHESFLIFGTDRVRFVKVDKAE